MGVFNKYSNLSQVTSIGLLLLIPKCSLCIFAISTSIVVCGVAPVVTPFWEYVLVGVSAFSSVFWVLSDAKANGRMIPMMLAIGGLVAIGSFLFFHSAKLHYYIGILMIAISWITLKVQRFIACRHA